jgi:hypothetical protein
LWACVVNSIQHRHGITGSWLVSSGSNWVGRRYRITRPRRSPPGAAILRCQFYPLISQHISLSRNHSIDAILYQATDGLLFPPEKVSHGSSAVRTCQRDRAAGRGWGADLDRRSRPHRARESDGHRRRRHAERLLQLDAWRRGELRGPQPHLFPDCRDRYAAHWHQRLAVSVRFDRREDWCRVSSAEAR